MDELKNQLITLLGCTKSDLESLIPPELEAEGLQYLIQWANVTRLSLKANRLIISQCLMMDEENHVLCRFCGEGIPNWKLEDAREHTAECPINNISDTLTAVKALYNSMEQQDK